MLAISLASCSGSSKSQSPLEPTNQVSDLPLSFGTDDTSGRNVLAVYDAAIDPVAKTFMVTPVTRAADYHLPLTQYFQNVLQITGYGFTPNFWADIKLIHPYPGSGIDGFDPRVIAILPANPDVSFNYPTLGVNGNNSVILEPDGYTKLFDWLGGSIAGNTNPFKAYFKDQSYCRWSSTGTATETQRWNMKLAGFGGPLAYKLVVDVCTNYPNPPAPVTDNAPEPVKIDATVGPGLTPSGGSADITAILLDWQWQSTIGGVQVEAPDLFNGTVSLAYSAPGPNPNEYVYSGTIENSLFAPEGEYKIIVAAWDQATGIYMYNEFSVFVSYVTGNLIWAKRAGGANDDKSLAITTLSDNSTVVTGIFSGTTTFGPGESNQTVLTSAGGWDIFIARFNQDGTLAWAKRAGGYDYDYGIGIATLSDNSTVVTGSFLASATFGPGELNQIILTSVGKRDIFIARYNPDGTLAWAKRAGGLAQEEGMDITTISDNSTVVTGRFYESLTFGKDEPNETVLTSAGDMDIFVARYNPDGTLAWAKRAGGSGHEYGLGITTLSDDSTVVTGGFKGTATFGLDETTPTVLTSFGRTDIYIARYNPDGTNAWAKHAGSISDDYGFAITVLSDNSTAVTGSYYASATFGPGETNQTVLTSAGEEDIFTARFNPDGSLAWAKSSGGATPEYDWGITSLSDNSTIITGWFQESATFGQGESNQTVLSSVGSADIFIARYYPNGTLAWAKRAGGSDWDEGWGITTLSDNSTVVTGRFSTSATFGPCEPNETVLTSAGGSDIFIARFEP